MFTLFFWRHLTTLLCTTSRKQQMSQLPCSKLISVEHRQSLTWLLRLPGDTITMCSLSQRCLYLSGPRCIPCFNLLLLAFDLLTGQNKQLLQLPKTLNSELYWTNCTELNVECLKYLVICCLPCPVFCRRYSLSQEFVHTLAANNQEPFSHWLPQNTNPFKTWNTLTELYLSVTRSNWCPEKSRPY